MASRSLAAGLSDLDDLDDFSLETTVPTDLTLSEDSDAVEESRVRKSKVTKQLLQRKQLMHDLQVCKIELSQKTMQFDNLKADHMQRVEDLEEKLSDALHQKQMLQARLEGQMQVQQDDSRRRQETIKQELDDILQKQQVLEEANGRLRERAGDVRRSLIDLEITEPEYHELRARDEDDLSLRQFVSTRFFELLRPVKAELDHMRTRVRTVDEEFAQARRQLDVLEEGLTEERRQHGKLQGHCQRLTLDLSDAKALSQQADYKRENYDRVKSERDELERECLETKREKSHGEATLAAVTRERDDLLKQVATLQQNTALLSQDKDYLTRQGGDVGRALAAAEDKAASLSAQLEDVKAAREQLYDKYVASRDQYKAEYERKLREELDGLRVRTDTEMDRLRTSTREMYERENRTLREARETAVSEKERAAAAEREANIKLEQLMADFRELQSRSDSKISEVQNELRVKGFEAERAAVVCEETCSRLKQAELEIQKLTKKLELVNREYYQLQGAADKRGIELETLLDEARRKLSVYEKLEGELDDVVMQAAQVDSDAEAEKVLFAHGYGANVPSTAKRRLQQSVHLARRLLQLERANTTLRGELDTANQRSAAMTEELERSENLLKESQQPYSYLVEGLRTRDTQIAMLRAATEELENQKKHLQSERADLAQKVNHLSADLERLLNQREEMSVMKQVVANLAARRRQGNTAPPDTSPRHTLRASARSLSPRHQATRSARATSPRSTARSGGGRSTRRGMTSGSHAHTSGPAPLLFTKERDVDTYRQLKQRSMVPA